MQPFDGCRFCLKMINMFVVSSISTDDNNFKRKQITIRLKTLSNSIKDYSRIDDVTIRKIVAAQSHGKVQAILFKATFI